MMGAPYDIQHVRIPSTALFTFSNESSFRGHPLYSKRQQQDELPIGFSAGRYKLHTTHAHQQESDLTFLRNFKTSGNVCRPERQTPYIMTNVSASPELTDLRNLVPSVAPPVYNKTMGLLFTAPIVPQSTPARIS